MKLHSSNMHNLRIVKRKLTLAVRESVPSLKEYFNKYLRVSSIARPQTNCALLLHLNCVLLLLRY